MRECDELIFLQASYQDPDLGLDKADPVGNEILGSLHVKSIYTECYWHSLTGCCVQGIIKAHRTNRITQHGLLTTRGAASHWAHLLATQYNALEHKKQEQCRYILYTEVIELNTGKAGGAPGLYRNLKLIQLAHSQVQFTFLFLSTFN